MGVILAAMGHIVAEEGGHRIVVRCLGQGNDLATGPAGFGLTDSGGGLLGGGAGMDLGGDYRGIGAGHLGHGRFHGGLRLGHAGQNLVGVLAHLFQILEHPFCRFLGVLVISGVHHRAPGRLELGRGDPIGFGPRGSGQRGGLKQRRFRRGHLSLGG